MTEPMTDARLEQLAGLAELPCSCADADCGNFTAALTAQEVRELVAEAKRARAELKPLRPEYGIRAVYISGRILEVTVAETLNDAMAALDEFDVKHGDNVASRELCQRPVGEWGNVRGDGG